MNPQEIVKIGMIGLDTSHCPGFTDVINNPEGKPEYSIPELSGFKIVAAYPYGSRTIESSYSRIPRYIEEVKAMGVEITDSLDELLESTDVIMLETNDGKPRLEQSIEVFKAGKTIFMDKPIAASLADAIAILEASKEYNVPMFTTSGMRYIIPAQEIRYENKIGKVLGANTYNPSTREPSHADLYWYGIHGVEALITVMGTGCKSVTREETDIADVVTGVWDDGRIGVYRGLRKGWGSGGTVFGTDGIVSLERGAGREVFMGHVLEFFRTGISPVSLDETLEVYAFMEAADESKRQGGASVSLDHVISKARKK